MKLSIFGMSDDFMGKFLEKLFNLTKPPINCIIFDILKEFYKLSKILISAMKIFSFKNLGN
jgi:hypothetical protein